jgi:antitoxin HigA-1
MEAFDMKRRPTHPGKILKLAVLEPLSMTITEAAKNLGVTRKAISELVNERSAMSPEMAVRIARATDTTPESWINMQSKLDIWEAEQKKLKVTPFQKVG